MNSHMPAGAIGGQSNTDAQPVCTKHQSEMYCCKYVSKAKRKGTRTALYEVIEDMERKDTSGKNKYGDDYEESKLGGKIH